MAPETRALDPPRRSYLDHDNGTVLLLESGKFATDLPSGLLALENYWFRVPSPNQIDAF